MNHPPRPGAAGMASAPDADWQRHAACRGADLTLFFAPEIERLSDRQEREARAKAICAGCPVRLQCLEFRLDSEQQMDAGIWGGEDENERRRIRRNRMRAQRGRAA